MDYESFLSSWNHALRKSGLPIIGLDGEETLDTRSLDRHYKVYVEPLGRQDAPPFHVTAELGWTWDVLTTARTRSTEEETLTWLLGREEARGVETVAPWLRIDVILRASAPFDQPIAMPDASAWSAWVKETMGRLERIEALLPDETFRETDDGRVEVLAWKDEPDVTCRCGPDGKLRLKEVELASFVCFNLPRHWDDPDRDPDEPPDAQLEELFGRVRASLCAWMQTLDHLRPKNR